MKKKYTKKQEEAISSVVCMLDELENKPRRLYTALREMAHAFLDDKPNTRYVAGVLNRIDEAEITWYSQWNFERELSEMLYNIRRTSMNLTNSIAQDNFKKSYKNDNKNSTADELSSRWHSYIDGVMDMKKQAMRQVAQSCLEEFNMIFD